MYNIPNWKFGMLQVNSLNLSKTFHNKSSFVDSNVTINISRLLDYAFILYASLIIGK